MFIIFSTPELIDICGSLRQLFSWANVCCSIPTLFYCCDLWVKYETCFTAMLSVMFLISSYSKLFELGRTLPSLQGPAQRLGWLETRDLVVNTGFYENNRQCFVMNVIVDCFITLKDARSFILHRNGMYNLIILLVYS